MGFHQKIEGDVALLPLEGKIMGGRETTMIGQQLQDISTQGCNKIILDFDNVRWINSPGIGMLIKWLRILREAGGDLKFINAGTQVMHYFHITKLTSVIGTYDCYTDAVRSFQYHRN